MRVLGWPLPYLTVALQLVTSLVTAAGFVLVDTSQAIAALLAGAVCIVPAAWLAWAMRRERSGRKLLAQGLMKFLVTVILMGFAFAWWRPPALGFFSALVLMQLMYVAAPLIGRDGR